MKVEEAQEAIERLKLQPKKWLYGIDHAIDKIVMSLFTLVPYSGDGEKKLGQAHVLHRDVPGVGKTELMRVLSFAIGAGDKSVLITGNPEMTKSQIIGGEVYNRALEKFFLRKGPIFHNIILFDEINRTHPKGQSEFLSAMEERLAILEITNLEASQMEAKPFKLFPIADDSDELFFWVLATANPIEQEGTYPLPEAQLDRFSFSIRIGYPPRDKEKMIRLKNVYTGKKEIENVLNLSDVLAISRLIIQETTVSSAVNEYIMRINENSRPSAKNKSFIIDPVLTDFISKNIIPDGGLTPRSNFHFESAARTHAFLRGSHVATVDDVKAVAGMVMEHRMLLTPLARGSGVSQRNIVERLIDGTEVP